MTYPDAVSKPVANHGGPMGQVFGLVVHVQEGDGSLAGWFNNPASQVSAHFWISKTGVVEQYVDTGTQAWAQVAGNLNYLSVETEGFDTEPLTAAQLTELTNLFAWVRAQYPAVPDTLCDHGQMGLTTHAHYPSGVPDPAWGGHPCPGPIRTGQLPQVVTHPTPSPTGALLYIAHSATRQVQVFDSGKAVRVPAATDGSALTDPPLSVPYVGPFSEAYLDNLLA